MAVNLTIATYEGLRSLPKVGHATANHLIQVRDSCKLENRPFNFTSLAEKPHVQTIFDSLIRKGECFFEDKTGTPSELDPICSDVASGGNSQDDGEKEQAPAQLAPEVDKGQASSLQSSQEQILDIIKNISFKMGDFQLSLQELHRRQDDLDSKVHSVQQSQAAVTQGPDVRPKMEAPSNPRRSSREPPVQYQGRRNAPVDQNNRQPDRHDAKSYIPKLKSYIGVECFPAWLTKFENFQGYYRWTDNDALFYLIGLLVDEPSEFFENLRPEVKLSYLRTTAALVKTYG